MTRSTSNSSMSRLGGSGSAQNSAPPPVEMAPPSSDNVVSNGISSAYLPTPANNGSNNFNFDGSPLHLSQTSRSAFKPDPLNPDHRRGLPRPLPPSKCPLLCVFYAEFDIVVGPKVCFQSPNKFMQFDVDVGYDDVHTALEETFQAVVPQGGQKQPSMVGKPANNTKETNHVKQPGVSKANSDEYWNWSQNQRKATIVEREVSDLSSQITLPSSGHKDENHAAVSSAGIEVATEAKSSVAPGKPSLHEQKQSSASAIDVADDSTKSHSRNPSFSSSKCTTSNQATHEGDTSTIDTELLQNSIFTATSEYIITGNELANQTITVSTHGMHILSRPMVICDTQRYERNSLLFAVGFVLRRNVDPRPYWPVLSNLSSTFRYMEVESEFLSHNRPQIQIVLEDILVSLNSKQRDCHLLLDDANLLNLHLFRPPPPPTPPVPDYSVPILLRPADLLQMFDWDLTINWIVPHIDGCKYVKQIAVCSEVDMEMVRACLRVLRHHGVLTHVDVFRYSNIYECTPLAMSLLAGIEEEAKKLLDAAFRYCAKSKYLRRAHAQYRDHSTSNDVNSPTFKPNSPSNNAVRKLRSGSGSLHSLDLSNHMSRNLLASVALAETSKVQDIAEDMSSPRSSRSVDQVASPSDKGKILKEMESMKKALAQLFTSCSRSQSFGEVLMAKIENKRQQEGAPGNPVVENNATRKFVESELTIDAVLTPLHEASPESEPAIFSDVRNTDPRHGTNGGIFVDATDVDWRLAFDYFDHRRLVTFGVVRGLIRRVHQYPLAYEIEPDNGEEANSGTGRESNSSFGDLSNVDMSPEQYHMPIEISAIAEAAAAAAAAKMALDERSKSTSYSNSPLLQGIPHPPVSSRGEIFVNKLTQKELYHKSKKLLLNEMAAAMDGTRCDDELSCMFEVPIETLIGTLKSTGRWDITTLFSCTAD
ncbi:hypothetical protein ACHAWF_016846 [Thalassiosira exigua]